MDLFFLRGRSPYPGPHGVLHRLRHYYHDPKFHVVSGTIGHRFLRGSIFMVTYHYLYPFVLAGVYVTPAYHLVNEGRVFDDLSPGKKGRRTSFNAHLFVG